MQQRKERLLTLSFSKLTTSRVEIVYNAASTAPDAVPHCPFPRPAAT